MFSTRYAIFWDLEELEIETLPNYYVKSQCIAYQELLQLWFPAVVENPSLPHPYQIPTGKGKKKKKSTYEHNYTVNKY